MERKGDPRAALPETLKSLGFTKYEALVYVALLGMEAATATEIHELSRVPRASVYPVLDRLMEKNLVAVSHGSPRRYSAIPPGEGIENLLSRIEGDARKAKEILSEIYRKRVTVERGDQELIWSIHGEEKIISRLRDLLRGAKKKVQVSTSRPFLERTLLPVLRELPQSIGIEVVTSSWKGPVPRGMKVHVRPLPGGHGQLPAGTAGIFIIDGEKAMVVMGISGETPTALFSESPGFLRFFSQIWSLNLAFAAARTDEQSEGSSSRTP